MSQADERTTEQQRMDRCSYKLSGSCDCTIFCVEHDSNNQNKQTDGDE